MRMLLIVRMHVWWSAEPLLLSSCRLHVRRAIEDGLVVETVRLQLGSLFIAIRPIKAGLL